MNMKDDKIEAEVLESSNNVTLIDDDEEKEEIVAGKEDVVKEKKEETNNDTLDSGDGEKTEFKRHKHFETRQKKKGEKNSKFFIIVSVLLVLIVLLILAFCTVFALINFNNETILSGVSIRNTKVEGLTKAQALEVVNNAVDGEQKQEITLKINGDTYTLAQEQIEVKYDVEKAVEEAYNIGRDGNLIQNNFSILRSMFDENNIEINITYNEELLEKVLKEIEVMLPNVMADNTYYVEEDELIISRGTDGINIDIEDAKNAIINSIKTGNTENVEIKTVFKECPEIDIDKIYSEVKTEPQNASYKKDPFEIIPHKTGTDFDLESAKEMLKEEKDEYVIKLNIIEPEVHTNEIGDEAFPDQLSSFSTKYDESNRPRSKNLKIAMSKLNGVVVMPGEVFSYNKTLGKRTVEEGYENANGFSGGKVVPMLAGGICQISSTLYDAILYANLNIVERHNHMFQATYVEPGKDATVVYGSLDFKFQNTRKYPIMIKTTCGNGVAQIKIFGNKEEVEYDIDIVSVVQNYVPYKVVYEDDTSLAPGVERVSQYGLQGCKSTTYRVRKLNGEEISREVLSTDTYSALNKIIRRGVTSTRSTTSVEAEATTEIEQPEQESTATVTPTEKPTETQSNNNEKVETPTTEKTETQKPEPKVEQTPQQTEKPVQPKTPELTEDVKTPEG